MTHPTPAAVVAARIAERLGWSEQTWPPHGECIYAPGPITDQVECLWTFHGRLNIYSPGTDWTNFGMRLNFNTPFGLLAEPCSLDRHRWTDEGREFFRTIDGICDGLITAGLTNANETACLEWLAGRS